MDLFFFIIILAISIILIIIGLIIREHTELSIIGFAFLFMLAMILITSDIQRKTGENSTVEYIWGCDNYTSNTTIIYIMAASESKENVYETYAESLSRTIGYWLAVASIVGFVGIIVSLRRAW